MYLKIGIDSGKSLTKYAIMRETGAKEFGMFPTTVRETKVEDGPFVVKYNGKRYVVGDESSAQNEHSTDTCKINHIHKISAITAICDVIQKQSLSIKEVKATINMPLNEYLNVEKRKQVMDLYNESIEINVNGRNYLFNLKVKPYFEGSGAALKNPEKLGGADDTIIIDLGSLNVNVATFDSNKKPIRSKCRTFKGGITGLLYNIQHAIAKETGEELDLNSISKIITGEKKTGITNQMIEIVKQECIQYLNDLKTKMRHQGIDPTYCRVIFAGGGAKILRNYIRGPFAHNVHVDYDDVFANAIGSMAVLI
jgi:hypothetical protein